jgi:hypothetical protein
MYIDLRADYAPHTTLHHPARLIGTTVSFAAYYHSLPRAAARGRLATLQRNKQDASRLQNNTTQIDDEQRYVHICLVYKRYQTKMSHKLLRAPRQNGPKLANVRTPNHIRTN